MYVCAYMWAFCFSSLKKEKQGEQMLIFFVQLQSAFYQLLPSVYPLSNHFLILYDLPPIMVSGSHGSLHTLGYFLLPDKLVS